MDACFVDITVEFLAVAFHSILHIASVYPESIFEPKRKYNLVVHESSHPEVNQYIDLCLKSIAECLKSDQLTRVVFAVTDSNYTPLMNFVFDFDKNQNFDETADAYLVLSEQNLRAFLLKLSSLNYKFKNALEDCSFSINIHTNESVAVNIASNPDFEEFPLVEVEQTEELDKVVPLRRFSMRNYNIDIFVEIR